MLDGELSISDGVTLSYNTAQVPTTTRRPKQSQLTLERTRFTDNQPTSSHIITHSTHYIGQERGGAFFVFDGELSISNNVTLSHNTAQVTTTTMPAQAFTAYTRMHSFY